MMDFKEHIIVNEWKDTPTENILELRKSAVKLKILNTQWIIFYSFLLIFTFPSIVLILTRGYDRDLMIFTINFILYFFIWIFHLKKKVICEETHKRAIDILNQTAVVLKYR